MAHIYQRVVALISEEPMKRPDSEINLLLPWFQSMSNLFKAQKTDVVKDILRNCEFRSVPQDDVIITQGARGDSFYIILGGAVSVYINQTLEERGNVDQEELIPDKDHVTVDCNGNELGTGEDGGPGKSFGELALVQTNSIRNASVIADYPTDLIVIHRELYNRSLKAAQKQEVQEKLDFVSSHDLFSTWTRRQRAVLTMSLIRSHYQYGNAIIRQGSPTESLIFITKGQAKVTVNPRKLIQQYPSMCSAGDLPDRRNSSRFDRVRHRKRHKLQSPAEDDNPTDGIAGHKHVYEMCIVGRPDFIGEFEVLLRLPTYIQTVTSMEEVETLELDLTSFTRLIAKKKPATYQHMHNIAEMKLISRLRRLENDQIRNPVFQEILQRFTEFNSSFQENKQSTSDPEDYSNDPRWYEYRDKQRRFLQNRRAARAAKERRESMKLRSLMRQRISRTLPSIQRGNTGSKAVPTDGSDAESEILPVISHNTRININPASGLVRLPRRMYSLDDPAVRTRKTSVALDEVERRRSRSCSVSMATEITLPRTIDTLLNIDVAKSVKPPNIYS